MIFVLCTKITIKLYIFVRTLREAINSDDGVESLPLVKKKSFLFSFFLLFSHLFIVVNVESKKGKKFTCSWKNI